MPSPNLTLYECVTLWIQGLGVVVVALYTILTWRQVKALRESNETNRQALEETRKSNDYTQESNRLTEVALTVSNRAWLSMAVEPVQFREDGAMPGLCFVMRNHGRVPATSIIMTNGFGLFDKPLTSMPSEIQRTGDHPQSIAMLAPDSRMSAIPDSIPALGSQDLEDVRSGRLLLYVFGRATYQHGLGGSGEISVACFYGPNDGHWTYAPFGNTVR